MNHLPLTEDDLLHIFARDKKSKARKNLALTFLSQLFVLLSIFFVAYFAINFNAYVGKFDYWFKNDFQSSNLANYEDIIVPQPGIGEEKVEAVTQTQTPSLPVDDGLPKIDDNSIYIPAINIKAPITWRVNNTDKDTNAALEKGVIHLAGTVLPGERGNMIISGHSSNYIWAKGDYNQIFSLLDKLVVGDKIQIRYQSKNFVYTVSEKKVVLPKDKTVLQQTEDSRLTLSTCWPVGTALKRLILISEQSYPDSKTNTRSNETLEQHDKLPAAI